MKYTKIFFETLILLYISTTLLASSELNNRVPSDLAEELNGLETSCSNEKICGPLCQKLVQVVNEFTAEINKDKKLDEDPRPCVACAFHHVLKTLAEKRLWQMHIDETSAALTKTQPSIEEKKEAGDVNACNKKSEKISSEAKKDEKKSGEELIETRFRFAQRKNKVTPFKL